MPPEAPRRYLIAAGIECYDSPSWGRLHSVPQELARVVGLLTDDRFRMTRILDSETKHVELIPFLRAVRDWTVSDDRRPDDHLTVYWTGHGDLDGNRLVLALSATQDMVTDGLPVIELVRILLHAEARCGPILLILDVCCAGQAVIDVGRHLGDLTRDRPRDAPPRIFVFGATRAREYAQSQVFAQAFAEAVEASVDPEQRTQDSLDLVAIVGRVKNRLKDLGQVPLDLGTGQSGNSFLRNPYHVAHWPSVDSATQRLLLWFDPASRGVGRPEDAGWFFTGRARAFADLCHLLLERPASGMCRVTGDVGSGKTALLGRLYLLSRNDYRSGVSHEALAETSVPPLGAIDVAVIATGKTREAIADEIARALRVSVGSPAELFVALAQRSRSTVILVDGVDEAIGAKRVLRFLEDIAAASAFVIIGSRRGTVGQPRASDILIDLDAETWADHPAVEQYVLRCLRDAFTGQSAAAKPWQAHPEEVAASVAKRARGNFLIARLAVVALASGVGDDPLNAVWQFPDTVNGGLRRIFSKLGDDEDPVRDLLRPLVYAGVGGIPRGLAWAAMAGSLANREIGESDFDRLFGLARPFMAEDVRGERTTYRIFHAALSDLLRPRKREQRADFSKIADVLGDFVDGRRLGRPVDLDYARGALAACLRASARFGELSRRVTSGAWISRRQGGHHLDVSALSGDVEEAYAAARERNQSAARFMRRMPAMAMMAWRMAWRSGLVEQVEAAPAAAWPCAVKTGALSPAAALARITPLGDVGRRAIRLTLLAPLLVGLDLDEMLDIAQGLKGSEPASASSTEVEWYERVLVAALDGPDAQRIAPRALDAAARLAGYRRWLLLKPLLRHLDDTQFAQAGWLAQRMPPDNLTGWWRSQMIAAHAVEAARRGDPKAAEAALNRPEGSLERSFCAGALFASSGEPGVSAVLKGRTILHEFLAARDGIADWIQRLQSCSVLIASLTRLTSVAERRALASFLRDLHEHRDSDTAICAAAVAGKGLAGPHGPRLMTWAFRRFVKQSSQYGYNLNWYHTPPEIAGVFASIGDIDTALEAMQPMWDHDFHSPMAWANVFREAARHGGENVSAKLSELAAAPDAGTAFPALEAIFDRDQPRHQQLARDLLEKIDLSLGSALVAPRCAAFAALAHHRPPDEADVSSFLGLAGQLQQGAGNWVSSFAAACAAHGDWRNAKRCIDTFGEPRSRAEAWCAVLVAASEGAGAELLGAFLIDVVSLRQVLDRERLAAEFAGTVARMDLDSLVAICRVVQPWRDWRGGMHTILAAAAVRAFEIGAGRFAIEACDDPLALMEAGERLRDTPPYALVEARIADLCEAWLHSSDELRRHLGLAARAIMAMRDGSTDTADDLGRLVMPWAIEGLSPVVRKVAVDRVFRELLANETDGLSSQLEHFAWALPDLDRQQITRLLDNAAESHDDYYRDEAVVLLLPHVAASFGVEFAREIAARVRRSDFIARSSTSLWPYLSDDEREKALHAILSGDVDMDLPALAGIAGRLSPAALAAVITWVLSHHEQAGPGSLSPFVDAALQLEPRLALSIWEAIVDVGSTIRLEPAMGFLSEAIPFVDRLGGERALADVDSLLAQAASQWP